MTRDETDHVLTDARDDAPSERPNLSHAIRAHLGDYLRDTYERIGAAEMPSRFTELLDQLEAALRARGEAIEP